MGQNEVIRSAYVRRTRVSVDMEVLYLGMDLTWVMTLLAEMHKVLAMLILRPRGYLPYRFGEARQVQMCRSCSVMSQSTFRGD